MDIEKNIKEIQEILTQYNFYLANLKVEIYSGEGNIDNLIYCRKLETKEVITIYRAEIYTKGNIEGLTFKNLKGEEYTKLFDVNFGCMQSFKENLRMNAMVYKNRIDGILECLEDLKELKRNLLMLE